MQKKTTGFCADISTLPGGLTVALENSTASLRGLLDTSVP